MTDAKSSGVAPIDVRQLLERHGIAPKKALGQNFLIDPNVLRRIARTAIRSNPEVLVEIGPGLGSLTRALAEENVPVVAIERDARLLPVLRELFANSQNVSFVEGDATTADFAALTLTSPPKPGDSARKPGVVGNLPYSVTTPLLLALLRQRDRIGATCVMVQREFANRLVAAVGSDDYGSLTVLFRAVADVARAFDVSPHCFRPVPKVTSSVLTIDWLPNPRTSVPLAQLEVATRAAFGQRRKMMRNSLKTHFSKEAIARADICVDLSRRAETLDLSEFERLAAALSSSRD
ncbi:MAG: ribosomal RNA small subunit methyltransferase A [Deltaproteobacteria bacterium]|nr:ribosomal RNA small subunit methyltransferase A [Deltaproteobacteria bacterium]